MSQVTVTAMRGVTFHHSEHGTLRYIYPQQSPLDGMLLKQNEINEWVPLRKATQEDISDINTAIGRSHHSHA